VGHREAIIERGINMGNEFPTVGQVTSPHEDYPFNPGIKLGIYKKLVDLLQGVDVQLACSFPHLSNYRMERIIKSSHPNVRFHCFEKDVNTFRKIQHSFNAPQWVELLLDTAENFIQSRSDLYDLIFFDYMGGPKEDIRPLLEQHLREGGDF
jgi:hypothetical protein